MTTQEQPSAVRATRNDPVRVSRDDLDGLKARVSLFDLVLETQGVDHQGKVCCPFHDDHTPSCQVYADRYHCFACGAHGDAIAWLMGVHEFDFPEAVDHLKRFAGAAPASTPQRSRKPTVPKAKPTGGPLSAAAAESHRRLAARLDAVPAALEGRYLTLDDCRALGIAAQGKDALLPITDPDGQLVAIKGRRHNVPKEKRFYYRPSGCGTPSWCSKGIREADTLLIVEGELNGIRAHLARPDLGVMGVAGVNTTPFLDVLEGKLVYIYADDDEAGNEARPRWAGMATRAGAAAVYQLEPLPPGLDFCDLSPADLRGFLS